MNAKNKQQKTDEKTIYILYVPGGAMHGIIPAVILSRLEELCETPTAELFQVLNGVSTGSLITGGLSVRSKTDAFKPKFYAHDSVELFCRYGPKFFPHIPGRVKKYMTASLINYFQDQVDPAHTERFLIRSIREACREINQANNKNPLFIRDIIEIRRLATASYISKRRRKNAAKKCQQLLEREDVDTATKENIKHLSAMILARRPKGILSAGFNKTVFGGLAAVKKIWAHDYLYDPKAMENTLKEHLGQARMGDAMTSLYISTLDLESRRMVTFFSRKKDFFSNDADTPSVTSEGNEKIWDAIMASTANPFAFPPHRTESGILCTDKALLHTPLPCVEDVLKHKPEGVNVKLVYAGTGLARYTHENERYVGYGVPGNLIDGREIDDLQRYTTSTANQILREKLGRENIIEINPVVTPEVWQDVERMPSADPLDASPEGISRTLTFTMDYIKQAEVDAQLKSLAHEMSRNLYNLGQMDEEKYRRVCERCGAKGQFQPANQNEKSDIDQTSQNILRNIIPRRFKWFR